ncbi:MAG: DUF4832 domain-containing protein [Cytophagaceae bacterium]|nr:DUF4832 domain-containing protein [Cytophagaceae bacterium]
MRKITSIGVAFIVFVLNCYAQQTTVNYTASALEIPNPERGFCRWTETSSSSHTALDLTNLIQLRQNNLQTLIFRYYYLNSFLTSPISTSYLNLITQDFNTIRQAGVKVIIRFAYTDNLPGSPPYNDSPAKSILLNHIQQLKPIIRQNSDVILTLQNGFWGVWGENYYSDQFGCLCNGPITAQNWADRKEITDSILTLLPEDRFLSIRYPSFKFRYYNFTIPDDSITLAEAHTGTTKSRIGYHNDCFLISASDYTFKNTATEKPYWETESKYTIMGGETCGDNPTYTNCPNALNDLENAHWTYLNDQYHPDVFTRWRNENCIDEIKNRMGYRLSLNSGTFDNIGNPGGLYNFSISLSNTGFASPVNRRDVFLIFRNSSDTVKLVLPVDPRLWFGDGVYTINTSVLLPANMANGDYNLYLSLPDKYPSLSSDPAYCIQMANSGVWETTTGYNNLNMVVTIFGPNGLAASNDIEFSYVESNDKYMLKGDLEGTNISILNVYGQKNYECINVKSDLINIDGSNMPKGLYFICVDNSKGERLYTKKIIKN